MMRAKIGFLIVMLTTATLTYAQKTILWKVTNTATNHTSYLMGTNHAIGSSFVDSFPAIEQFIQASSIIITETNLNAETDYSFYNSRTTTTPLREVLGERDSAALANVLTKRKNVLNKLTPGEINLYLITKTNGCAKYKLNDSLTIDEYIQALGIRHAKQLYYLESNTQQLEKIYQTTKKSDLKDLKVTVPYYLKKLNDTLKKSCALEDSYTSFNLSYRLAKACPKRGKLEILITERNTAWMQKLPTLVASNNCFIAVGLGHLQYKCGLVQQFRKLGYTVEPVNMHTGNPL